MARTEDKTRLQLLIAGLFGPGGEGPEPTAPYLETLLSRAQETGERDPASLERVIFRLFDVDTEAGEDLPIAAVTRVLDLGVIDKGWWIRADPVHLHPEHGRLILIDGRALNISPEEAAGLAAEIVEAYTGQGWLLKAPRPERWYLKPPKPPRITTTDLPTVVGQDIHPYLPRGKDGMAWHGILTEVQILLHTANANSARERRGELPVNSLWFWGGGRLPKIKPTAWAQLCSEEPVSLALARLAEVPSAAVPASFAEWRRVTAQRGRHLIVLDRARAAAATRDYAAWAGHIETLDREWMQPLYDALKGQTIDELVIATDTGRRFEITPRDLRRWWARRHRLLNYR